MIIFTPAANSSDFESEKMHSDIVDNTVRALLLNKTLPLKKIREADAAKIESCVSAVHSITLPDLPVPGLGTDSAASLS